MKKTVFIILLIILNSCTEEFQCESTYNYFLKNNCNIVVEKNLNKSSSFAQSYLNIKGKDLNTNKVVKFKPEPRGWEPYAKYISVGDTVVKKEGEAIMRIYKKDSVITVSYDNYCNKEKFNRENILTFVLRDSIKK